MPKSTPVGMKPLTTILNDICRDGKNRKKRGLPVPPLLLPLNEGNGRTTVLNYIADVFEESGRLTFTNLDRVCELSLSDSSVPFEDVVEEIFYSIDSACVYTNPIGDGFDGVIGIDISKLEEHINEPIFYKFCKNIHLRGNNTLFVFFINSDITDNTTTIITELQKRIPSVRWINTSDYTLNNLVSIAERIAESHGVLFESNSTRIALKSFIADCCVDSARTVENLICEIIATTSNTDILKTETITNLHNTLKEGIN